MSIEAPSRTPQNNETPSDDQVSEQLEFDYSEPLPNPVDTDDELSGWEKLQQHREINDLETQFTTPEAATTGETPVHPNAIPELSEDNPEYLQVLREDITRRIREHQASLEVKRKDVTRRIDEHRSSIESEAKNIPVSSPESPSEPVAVKLELGRNALNFRSAIEADDHKHAETVAREQKPSRVKEAIVRGIDKVQSTEYDAIVVEKAKEKLTAVKERFVAAKERTTGRIAHKLEIRERAKNVARIQQENKEAAEAPVKEMIQERIRLAEQEGKEISYHRKPGLLRRVGRVVARYARNSKAYVKGIHEAGKASVRNQNKSIAEA